MPPRINPCRQRGAAAIIVSIFIFLLLSIVYAQEPEESPKAGKGPRAKPSLESKSPQENRTPARRGDFTIGVNVDLVLTYTSVFDKAGRFVSGLKKENFKLFEDGVEQKITAFSQEDVPVSMGILLDLSGSMRKKIEQVNKAALAFMMASNPQDEVFLIGFSDETDLLQDYTSDIDEIKDALDNIVVSGGTAAYDAIYLGVQKAQTGSKPKKAVVVITDGNDQDSYYKLDELLAKVQESDVQIFCIGLLDPISKRGLFRKSEEEKARDALIKISEETGGKAFFPGQVDDIHGIVSEIASELRNQYSIGYFSNNSARDGSWRRVKVEISGAGASFDHLRYRRGYYAPKAP
jgi:Ca-activated chloride channel homolog